MSSPSAPEPRDPRLEQAGVSDEQLQQAHTGLMQNKPLPKDSYPMLPIILLFVFSALIFVAAVYIDHYSAGFDPMVYDEAYNPKNAAPAKPVQIDPVAQGKRLFNSICITCHQPTGEGIPGVYPPLAGSEWVLGNEERNVRILLHGLQGKLTVKGHDFNGVMPDFGPDGSNWSDDQIAYVLTFVRQEWGNKAGAIKPEDVAKIRAASAGHKGAMSEESLLEIK